MRRRTLEKKPRSGFSLVELVVVILVIGILAAVAAPKMFDTAGDARENGTRQSLAVIRDAVELYKAENGSYPPTSTLASALRPFLKGPFPAVQCGTNKNANVVESSQNPIKSAETGGAGWAYNPSTGEIVVNDSAFLSW